MEGTFLKEVDSPSAIVADPQSKDISHAEYKESSSHEFCVDDHWVWSWRASSTFQSINVLEITYFETRWKSPLTASNPADTTLLKI